jgi:benzoate membrane transport protein
MLAGVLVPLCVAPFRALATAPLVVGPVILVWLVATRLAPRWAVPAALVAAVAAIGTVLVVNGGTPQPEALLPHLEVTTPAFTVGALVGIALPLYIVTMASQNIPGAAVLASFGYRAPWRAALVTTGAGTLAAAPFGGHAVNLAAISAALAAGEEAGQDRGRRWVAALTSGCCYLLLAAGSAGLGALVAAGPPGVLETVAGLALLPTLSSSLVGALQDTAERGGAAVTFVIAASGLSIAGIGAAFWALAGGLVVRAVVQDGSWLWPSRARAVRRDTAR